MNGNAPLIQSSTADRSRFALWNGDVSDCVDGPTRPRLASHNPHC
jgi:hypothetical protein